MALAINAQTSLTGVVATAVNGDLTLTNDNSRESNAASTKNVIIGSVVNGLGLVAGDSVTTAYTYQYATNASDITSTADSSYTNNIPYY